MRINGGERHSDRHMQKHHAKTGVSNVCFASDGAPQNVYQKAATQTTVRHRQTHTDTECKYNMPRKSATQATVRHRQANADTSCKCIVYKRLRRKRRCATDKHMQIQNANALCIKDCDANDGAPQTDTCRYIMQMTHAETEC